MNGSESQKDRHRSVPKDSDKTSRGRESDVEKAARNSRNDDGARSLTRERLRPSDGDVAADDRVWSPQQDEVTHDKMRLRDDGTTRERRSRHRVDEPMLKVLFVVY